MVKFKKVFNTNKVILLTAVIMLLSVGAAYSFPDSDDTLRLPVSEEQVKTRIRNKANADIISTMLTSIKEKADTWSRRNQHFIDTTSPPLLTLERIVYAYFDDIMINKLNMGTRFLMRYRNQILDNVDSNPDLDIVMTLISINIAEKILEPLEDLSAVKDIRDIEGIRNIIEDILTGKISSIKEITQRQIDGLSSLNHNEIVEVLSLYREELRDLLTGLRRNLDLLKGDVAIDPSFTAIIADLYLRTARTVREKERLHESFKVSGIIKDEFDMILKEGAPKGIHYATGLDNSIWLWHESDSNIYLKIYARDGWGTMLFLNFDKDTFEKEQIKLINKERELIHILKNLHQLTYSSLSIIIDMVERIEYHDLDDLIKIANDLLKVKEVDIKVLKKRIVLGKLFLNDVIKEYPDQKIFADKQVVMDNFSENFNIFRQELELLEGLSVREGKNPLKIKEIKGICDLLARRCSVAIMETDTFDRSRVMDSLEYNIEIKTDENPKILPLDLFFIMDNFFSGSIKARDENRRLEINISISKKHGFWEYKHSDNGKGIPLDKQERIFDRDYSTKEEGGLGLWAARKILEQHGGALTLESEEGVGTTFIMRLPLSDNQPLEQKLPTQDDAMTGV